MTDLSRKMRIVHSVMEVYKKYVEFEKMCSEASTETTKATENKSRKRKHEEDSIVPTQSDHLQTAIDEPPASKKKSYNSMFGESGNCLNIQNVSLDKIQKIAHITERHFKILANLLFEDLRKTSNRGFFVAEDRLGLTLLYLAQGCQLKDLYKEHNLPPATINAIAKDTFEVIVEALGKSYLGPSTQDSWKRISENFAGKYNLPNCIGIIDGRTFKTRQKKVPNSATIGVVGVCVVASCDANYCITATEVIPHKRDKIYLQEPNGFTQRLLNAGITSLPNDDILPNSIGPFPYYFIGDKRFPLRSYLMTPFENIAANSSQGTNMDKEHYTYNEKLLHAQNMITNNTFGILRSRWKLLESTARFGDIVVRNMILACILLHNYLIINEDELYCPANYGDHWTDVSHTGEWRQNLAIPDDGENFERCKPFASNYVCYNGMVARDKLSAYFSNTAKEFKHFSDHFFMDQEQ